MAIDFARVCFTWVEPKGEDRHRVVLIAAFPTSPIELHQSLGDARMFYEEGMSYWIARATRSAYLYVERKEPLAVKLMVLAATVPKQVVSVLGLRIIDVHICMDW